MCCPYPSHHVLREKYKGRDGTSISTVAHRKFSTSNLLRSYGKNTGTTQNRDRIGAGGTPVDMGVVLIVFLVTLFCAAMLGMWCTLGAYEIEPSPMRRVPFTLKEGDTILGVMDTPEIVCFCIGQDVVEEKEYE